MRLEEAVARGDFAESSKDQLVVNLAHDLRTPLTSVLGYLDLVIKDKQLTEEQVKHFISIAYTKSRHLERLIEGLFEITRMNYGKLTIKQEQVNLSELLYQLHEELYPLFEKHYLTARLEVAPHLLTLGDGELLARVFENLLTNACRYGSDGIYVDIKGMLKDEDSIAIQVINYGSSIKQEDIPHIFDMYFMGDRVRSSEGAGTGLGLFIAKNIVEQHGGTISVTSDAISTCFKVVLPRSIAI
jgi:signal transduction histidine kinase